MSYPLLTERLSIEPLAQSDLESFLAYRQDPEIARFQSWDPSFSKERAIELIESQAGVVHPSEGEWLQLAIHNRATGELVGDLALHALAENSTSYEIGFTISKQYQRQGFAREAAIALIGNLSFQGAKKFTATTDSRNAPSIKVLKALGFQHQPAKGWIEEFKNELVTVEYFETV
jgi:RimJ/RimL family protein N-acetyltransferase